MSARGSWCEALRFAAFLFALSAGFAPFTWAQLPENAACADVELHSQVVEIHFHPVTEAVLLIDQLLGPCGSYKVPKSLKIVIVEDERARIARIVEAIGSWDLPPQSVEVDVSLILASLAPGGEEAPAIAEELREVSRTLSEVTRWTRYRRLGTASVRIMEGGEAELEITEHYRLRVRVGKVDAERGLVQIEPFELIRTPSRAEAASGLGVPRKVLGGTLDLQEGRMNLVFTPSRNRRRAIFLAMTVWPLDGEGAQIRAEER